MEQELLLGVVLGDLGSRERRRGHDALPKYCIVAWTFVQFDRPSGDQVGSRKSADDSHVS